MQNIYLYKMTRDSGCAPCVDNDILSLAICKPVIRRVAKEGDIIFGFGAANMQAKLVYIKTVNITVTIYMLVGRIVFIDGVTMS
jgi:hypothetical protein